MTSPANPSNPSLTKNTLLLIGLQVFSKLLTAVWTFYLARQLGAEGYGLWANVMSVAAILSALQDMGTSLIFIREVGHDRSRTAERFGTALILYPIFSLIFVALTLGSGLLLGFDTDKMMLLFVAALSFSALVPSLASQNILSSHEDFSPYVVATFWGTMTYLAVGMVLIHLKFYVMGVFVAMALGNAVLSFFVTRATVVKHARPEFKWDAASWREPLKAGFPLLINSMLYEAAIRLDRILIERFWSQSAVGFYQAAFTLSQLFREMLLLPMMNSFYPRMASTYRSDFPTFKNLFAKMNILMFLAAVPIAVFGSLFSSTIVGFFYGEKFAEAAPLLSVLIFMVPFMFISVLWGYVLVVEDRQKYILWTRAATLGLNFVLNWTFLPTVGVVMSAWAAVLSQIFAMAVYFWALRGSGLIDFVSRFLKIAAAGALSGAAAFLLRNVIENPWIGLSVGLMAGLLIYAGCIISSKVLTKQELEWFESQLLLVKVRIVGRLPFR